MVCLQMNNLPLSFMPFINLLLEVEASKKNSGRNICRENFVNSFMTEVHMTTSRYHLKRCFEILGKFNENNRI